MMWGRGGARTAARGGAKETRGWRGKFCVEEGGVASNVPWTVYKRERRPEEFFTFRSSPLRIFPTSSTFASDLADQPRGRLARAQSLHCVGFTPTRTGVAASLVQCIKLNQAEGERETAAARSLPVETRRITRHARLTHSNPPSPHSRSLALALSPRKLFVKRRHPSEATGDALAGGWVGAAAQHSQQKGASLLSSPRPPQRACVNRH
jgi:hypothetical protein